MSTTLANSPDLPITCMGGRLGHGRREGEDGRTEGVGRSGSGILHGKAAENLKLKKLTSGLNTEITLHV